MPVDLKRLQAVFLKVVEVEETAARLALLEQECGGDAELSERVKALLKAHAAADAPLFPSVAPMEDRDDRTWTAIPEAVTGVMIAGSYKLLEPIGEGGMGLVWMAEQRTPVRRLIALKLIKAGMDSRAVIARFEAERQALAMMDHPCIARVLDGGTTERGYPWFAMELVRGLPLTEYCDQRRMSVAERLELFIQICSAVQHAHQKGIIHRDLKPSNVLVTEHDGRPLPKVIDFGLAKALGGGPTLTDQTLHTSFGAAMGTLLYMAPEQVAINALDVDTRADIYALGVILYELLSGSTPVERQRLKDAAWDEIRRVIREEEPPCPSLRVSSSNTLLSLAAARDTEPTRLSGLIKGDLDWIVLKALEKDRNRRYETANALAADLRRHLSDEPVLAAPPTLRYRIRKLVRRHKGPIIAVTGVFLVLVLGIVGTTIGLIGEARARTEAERQRSNAMEQTKKAHEQENEAIQEKRQADHERDLANKQAYFASIFGAGEFLDRGELANVRRFLDEAPVSERKWEWGYLETQSDGSIGVLRGHQEWVASAAFSPDGTRIVTASGDMTTRVWDAASGKQLMILPGPWNTPFSAAFSPDGMRIVAAYGDFTARIWNASSGKETAVLSGHVDMVNSAAFSPDGSRVVTASNDKSARVWDAGSGRQLIVIRGHAERIFSVAFSPDGSRVITASLDKTARLWDADSGKELIILSGHDGSVSTAAFSPDGTRIVTASDDKTARVWDAASGKEILVLRGHDEAVSSAAFSPDGSRIVTASFDKTARIWDAGSGKEIAILRGHDKSVRSAAFSPDGTRIVTASSDTTARVWDALSRTELGVHAGREKPLNSAAFSPDGKRIVTASSDGTATIWNADSKSVIATLRGHSDIVRSAAFSPDGSRIVTASFDKTARVWDAGSGKELIVFRGHTGGVDSAAFSPDGTRIVTVDYWTAWLWDASSGKELALLSGEQGLFFKVQFNSAAFSPDGKRIVTASNDNTARIWDASSGKELTILRGHRQEVYSAAFSPDGTRIVTAARDNARVWDAGTGKEIIFPRGQEGGIGGGGVQSAAFSPDGMRIVTAGGGDARVWDAGTGKELAVLRGHKEGIGSAAFSPDGTRIVTASFAGIARIWDSIPAAERYKATGQPVVPRFVPTTRAATRP